MFFIFCIGLAIGARQACGWVEKRDFWWVHEFFDRVSHAHLSLLRSYFSKGAFTINVRTDVFLRGAGES